MVRTAFFHRHRAFLSEVKCEIVKRLPAVVIVGLPASRVRETAERIRSSFEHGIGLDFPRQRVCFELECPEDAPPLSQARSGADLALALALLGELGVVDKRTLKGLVAHGELALDGTIRPVRGSIGVARAAISSGAQVMLTAAESAPDCTAVGMPTAGVRTLSEAVQWLDGGRPAGDNATAFRDESWQNLPHLESIRGHDFAVQQIANAAVTGRGVILYGPRGCGKTMLARALHACRAPMLRHEAVESAEVLSGAGFSLPLGERPFRAPHHTVTLKGMFGTRQHPGEVDLASHGTLLLDEFQEFRPDVVRSLVQGLPSSTQLVLAVDDELIERPWERIPIAIHRLCPIQVRLTTPSLAVLKAPPTHSFTTAAIRERATRHGINPAELEFVEEGSENVYFKDGYDRPYYWKRG